MNRHKKPPLKKIHKEAMAARDKAMASIKNSSDIDKSLKWMKDVFPQPSGTEILRIKKETGLSWTDFKKIIEKV